MAVSSTMLAGAGAGAAASSGTSSAWTVYHGNPTGTGVSPPVNVTGKAVFTSPTLSGQIYGEPLVSGGDIYVATTADVIYALSATSGQVVWSQHVGTPVPASSLPCGDISPAVGIVGTPVIDPTRSELFAVADELSSSGQPSHHLVGLNLQTGAVVLNQDVDPAGSDPSAMLQRTGAALDAGRVVFGFGGNYGDCGQYHGVVEAVPETGGAALTYVVDSGPGQRQGALWMGGAAPEVDAAGNIWISVGNGSVTDASQGYDGSDSVIKLSPSLTRLDLFAPARWAHDNASDADLGSSAPALVPGGLVVQAGKSGIAYLLQGSQLGGVGSGIDELSSICNGDVSGGDAVVPTTTGGTVYLPCADGIVAVAVTTTPPSFHVLWSTSTGSSGPPIVAGGLVWTISQGGVLYGLSPSTGAAVEHFSIGSVANHFPTPAVGDGLLIAPAESDVVAYAAPSAAAPPPTTTTTSRPTTTTTAKNGPRALGHSDQAPSQGVPGWLVGLLVGLGLLMVGAVLVQLVRRRRAGPH